MSTRSLNKVQLIGNLTRDPELRYTPTGAAVCTIGLATNRTWTTESGEKKEETEFHRVIAWNKLAELCSQLLAKGRKIYVEGRLRTNTWQTADGAQRSTTEIVIEDMIILDSRRPVVSEGEHVQPVDQVSQAPSQQPPPVTATQSAKKKSDDQKKETEKVPNPQDTKTPTEDINPDDIPF
jgi:single-strand DNA-binding protein